MQTETLINRVKLAMLTMQRASWEQGVAAQALLELGEIDLVVLMAREAVLRQLPDGRLAGLGSEIAVTDPAANGVPVLYAARYTGDAQLKAAAQRMLDYLLHTAPRTTDGVLHHLTNAPQVWVDSFYMAPPFLAVAGQPDEAIRQVEGFRKLLWDPEKKLFSHIWDESKQDFGRRDFLGRGQRLGRGGYGARDPRPARDRWKPSATAWSDYIREVIDGCLAYQRPDGLFHNVVDDPTSFVETNLAQMLAYTIYRGVTTGWLERGYLAPADRMRAAAHAKVDDNGLVQDVCGSPDFDHPGIATEGQAFFLLMEAAHHDLG